MAAPKAKTAAKLLKPMRVVRFIMNTVKMRVLTSCWRATFAHKTLVVSIWIDFARLVLFRHSSLACQAVALRVGWSLLQG